MHQYQDDDAGILARPNQAVNEDYANVFIGHAAMYVFGEKYGIPALKETALAKLHSTLNNFILFEERFQDVLVLVHYIYENTCATVKIDPLRELITR